MRDSVINQAPKQVSKRRRSDEELIRSRKLKSAAAANFYDGVTQDLVFWIDLLKRANGSSEHREPGWSGQRGGSSVIGPIAEYSFVEITNFNQSKLGLELAPDKASFKNTVIIADWK
jgi:hypothetical protein